MPINSDSDDNACLSNTTGTSASANSDTTFQREVLWTADTLRALSNHDLVLEFEQASGTDSEGFVSALDVTTLRAAADTMTDNMADLQVWSHGALASVTEPGRHAASSLHDAVDLLNQAKHELALTTATLSDAAKAAEAAAASLREEHYSLC